MDSTSTIKNTLIQLLRYGVAGGTAAVVDYGTLWALTEWAGVHYLVSAMCAFIAGLAVNYVISIFWVFTENRFANRKVEFLIFLIIGVIGLGLNELIIYFFSDVIHIHYMIGKLISTVLVFFWNFFARKLILFSTTGKTAM